jgi:predicted SAM-dependent methyltransferase
MKSTILSEQYSDSLASKFKFECISFFGNLFYRFGPRNRFGKKYLNLGCGLSYFPNWTNADFYHYPLKFWKVQPRKNPDWMLDIRKPLRCSSNYWDGIFTEHTLEHITHSECFRLFVEFHRVLKKGGVVRIIVPDIRKAVEFYNDRSKHDYFVTGFDTGCEAIWEVTQNYYHKSVWDAELMIVILKKAGFTSVSEVSFGKSSSLDVMKDNPVRECYSLYIEAIK